ncbi:MAG: AraC family transcriptional regulator [Acetatifactor sp.]|nr:AraC family transcriptional regulator [Acetatifactor sp.]
MPDIDKQLIDQLDINQKNNFLHRNYEKEIAFYRMVQNGDIESLNKFRITPRKEGLGLLSEDPIENLKYHTIILAAILARFCINGGMNIEISYTLSDLYIQTLSKLRDEDKICSLHREMVYNYANRMRAQKNNSSYPKHVRDAMDYIQNHLTQQISLDELSGKLYLNKSYLCALFKRTTGTSMGQYIEEQRILRAKHYMEYTEMSFTEIAQALHFSSSSHFSRSFKKITGYAPRDYKLRSSETI